MNDTELHIPHEVLLRPAGIIGLTGIALIHFLDLFDKFKETPYLGVAYVFLIGACVGAAALLLRGDARPGWTIGGVAAALTLVAFVLSRSVGLPSAHGDVGNWTEPLGLASVFVELAVVLISGYATLATRRRAAVSIPPATARQSAIRPAA